MGIRPYALAALLLASIAVFPAQAQTDAGQFVPCSGYGQPRQVDSHNPGPWAHRLLIATSADGLTWQRTNRILSDQADVPDALVTADGEVRVYYITWCPESISNRVAVAASTDEGETWTYRVTTLTSTDGRTMPFAVDPTVEILDDGRYRMYFTAQIPPAQHAGSYSAISDDGYHFTLEPGVRFSPEGANALDVNVLRIGETWHYFAGGQVAGNWHAVSADGLTFTAIEPFASGGVIMANGVPVAGGYRYYGFVQTPASPRYIVSLFTENGETWTQEDGIRLEMEPSAGLEAEGVKDPAVVQLPSGNWLMIYVSMIPEFPLERGS